MDRIILHIDVNSAFLSWSSIKLLQSGYKKDIRNEISVIAGNPKKRHGIIVAASIPAKKMGIKPPINLLDARKIYKDIIVVPPDYYFYKKCSLNLMNYIKSLFPIVEQYSIDECYVDYTGMNTLYGNEVDFAYKLKDNIYKKFGFTVNIGIGNNKLSAKMASDFEKPNKVHTLYEYEFKEKVWNLDISNLFMAGKSSCKKLRELNINTIGELANSDKDLIYRNLKSLGLMLHNYANGIDNSKLSTESYIERKGIGYSKTLEEDTENISEIYKYLKVFSKNISNELKRRKLYASTLVVTIRTNDFKTTNHQKKYTNSFCQEDDIYSKSITIFKELWDLEPIRLIGLRVTDFTENNSYQLSLFDETNQKENEIDKIIDNLNSKLGNNLLYKGSKLKKK